VKRLISPLTHDQCVTRLSLCGVGRVSLSIGALPVVVPVRYLLDGESVVFCAPLDEALADACDGSVVAFEVDDLTPSDRCDSDWSVHLVGVCSRLAQHDQARLLDRGPWDVNGDDRNHVMRLPITRLSGHELSAMRLPRAG
jgi:uncharacterized protein